MIFGINTTRDISKLSQILLAQRLVKLSITISKYRSWYLCQISLQIMLLPIHIHCLSSRFFEIQPNEISSQVSEKASKVRFLYDKPEKLQNHSNEEIGREKKKTARGRKGGEEKKSSGRPLSFYNSSFGSGAASFSTIVVGLRWPHLHFDLLSVLAHPNNA